MKKIIKITVLCCGFAFILSTQARPTRADSIIINVLKHKDLYDDHISAYDAQVYIKGYTDVKKRNFLARYAPDFLYWNRRNDRLFVEAIADLHYSSPNYFTHQIKALNGSQLEGKDIRERLMQFLNVNIYQPAIFNEQILLLDDKHIFRYYLFEYEGATDTTGTLVHQIRIIPKLKSHKLIEGLLYIVDGAWTVSRFELTGRWELFDFKVETVFGSQNQQALLPVESRVTFHLKLLGNERTHYYFSHYDYRKVETQQPAVANTNPYDISCYFRIQTDSVYVNTDSTFWEQRRPVALQPIEQEIIAEYCQQQTKRDTTFKRKPWILQKGVLKPAQFEYNHTYYRYSGLFNPLKLAYSALDGILYWQQIRMKKTFQNGQTLDFSPETGILFQKKEIYVRLPINWTFKPEKFGKLSFGLENRNQSYNSSFTNRIEQILPDSIDFDDLHLKYYKHYQGNLSMQYELFNGFLLYGGLYYDWYDPVRGKSTTMQLRQEVVDLVRDGYSSIAPVVGLRWVPGQYFRINGRQKEYLHSHYPTFNIEYARAIGGVLNSNSQYERIEVEIQQKIPIGLLQSLNYYGSAGWFTNVESVFFADFSSFRQRHIPRSWEDPIGGTFHLLEGHWYNAANRYAQLHLMFESPFLLSRLLSKIPNDILKERFYLSHLNTPALPSYSEFGYGFGNFYGNFGIFCSFKKWNYLTTGIKVVLEM